MERQVTKTNPIGVRFDKDLLQVLKEDGLANSPQKALNYLTEFYRVHQSRPDFKKLFKDSKLFNETKLLSGSPEFKTEILVPKGDQSIGKDVNGNFKKQIEKYEAEMRTLGEGAVGKQRKYFLEKKIKLLKTSLK